MSNYSDNKQNNKRAKEVVDAIARIESKGYPIYHEDSLGGGKTLKGEALEAIIRDIESRIINIGSFDVLFQIFAKLRKAYCSKQERYHMVRNVSTLEKGSPQVPWGLLYQLTLKNIRKIPCVIAPNPSETWKTVIKDIVDVCAAHDVQEYSQWESLHRTPENIISMMQDIAIYDSLFTFQQMKHSHAILLLENLFTWVDNKELFRTKNFTIRHCIDFFKSVMFLFQGDPHKPLFFCREDIYRQMNGTITPIIDSVLTAFSHSEPEPNYQYNIPTDFESVNSMFKPILKIDHNRYLFPNKASCSSGFFESTATAVREAFPSPGFPKRFVDNSIGVASEIFLRTVLKDAGVKCNYGDYSEFGFAGDIDAVVETSKLIILFEIKKKSLTRKARAGIDVNIFVDIAESQVKALRQLTRQEYILRKKNELTLTSQDGDYTVKLSGRNIERIVVSLLDFGSFNDRNTFRQITQNLLSAKYETYFKDFEDTFIKMNKWCKEVGELEGAIQKTKPSADTFPFMNTWFLSMPQILTILEDVNSADEFGKQLFVTRSVITGSKDFYSDYEYVKSIRNHGTK